MTSLTPTEQATVTRFGIHDDDVIADMVRHRRKRPRCDHDRRRGVVRMACRNCHLGETWCRRHHRTFVKDLRTARTIWCPNCDVTVPVRLWRSLISETFL